jgi:hypothetical protein
MAAVFTEYYENNYVIRLWSEGEKHTEIYGTVTMQYGDNCNKTKGSL